MSRAVPAVLTVLALAGAPLLTGCGGDEESSTQGAATTAPAVTTAPSVPAPTTTAPVPTTPAPGQDDPASPAPAPKGTETLEAPGSDPPPSAPTVREVQRPAKPLYCPGGGNGKGTPSTGGFDARELLGLSTAKAKALARRNDCVLRVVNRDGQDLIRTMDYSNGRVNVTETEGRVVALNGIG